MNDQDALEYIRGYFDELFGKHNLAALDNYLDKDYFDDDIGDSAVDHIQNSKEYLRALFKNQPTIAVEVNKAVIFDNVITTYLEWYVLENGARKTLHKGVAVFVMKDRRIFRRHTYHYDDTLQEAEA